MAFLVCSGARVLRMLVRVVLKRLIMSSGEDELRSIERLGCVQIVQVTVLHNPLGGGWVVGGWDCQ